MERFVAVYAGRETCLGKAQAGDLRQRVDISGYAPGMYFATFEGHGPVRFVVAR